MLEVFEVLHTLRHQLVVFVEELEGLDAFVGLVGKGEVTLNTNLVEGLLILVEDVGEEIKEFLVYFLGEGVGVGKLIELLVDVFDDADIGLFEILEVVFLLLGCLILDREIKLQIFG